MTTWRRRASRCPLSLVAVISVGLVALPSCANSRDVACVLCVENPTCEAPGVLVFWGLFGISEELVDPADRSVATLSVGDELPLRLNGANAYGLDCLHQLVSVAWVSTHPEVVRIDESSRTEVTLLAVGVGTSDIYADIVLDDGQQLRAVDSEVRQSAVTVTTIRVVEPASKS